MISNDELVTQLLDKVSERVVNDLRSSIAETVEKEIHKNISRTLVEGEFFRRVNGEMQDGLKRIYKEINEAKADGQQTPQATPTADQADELFSEASDQLDQILQTTENATVEIMEIVERHMDLQLNVGNMLQELKNGTIGDEDKDWLVDSNNKLNEDLMKIMTSLSFQDLTGQRIKRIIGALKEVEQITFDLYMSTGLKIKAQEENPDKDITSLENETKQRVTDLKGPQEDSSQGDVDDLLAQLGM